MEVAKPVSVAISIDTEEDNWGAYERHGASTRNIRHLLDLQDLFDRWGARATYLVNRPPLLDRGAVEVLGVLASKKNVEIGAHCHPWNTPPYTDDETSGSMMCDLPTEANRAKLRQIGDRMRIELGIRPSTFRAGRWGFGPTVAGPLLEEGYQIDCSITPFLDWSPGGPDYSESPHKPYRFEPNTPFKPDLNGRLLELPATIGFLQGTDQVRSARRRRSLERSALGRLRVVGIVDRAGFLAMRWLSPETSSGTTMIRVAESWVASGERFLQATFHSSTLLPGATPFVRTAADRVSFLERLDAFLAHCVGSGYAFRTLTEFGQSFRAGSEECASV